MQKMRIAECGPRNCLDYSRPREWRFSVHIIFGIKGIGDSYEHKESQWLISVLRRKISRKDAKPQRRKQ
jgi:hypothetical protein